MTDQLSLTSLLGKLVESIIKARITQHGDKRALLKKNHLRAVVYHQTFGVLWECQRAHGNRVSIISSNFQTVGALISVLESDQIQIPILTLNLATVISQLKPILTGLRT